MNLIIIFRSWWHSSCAGMSPLRVALEPRFPPRCTRPRSPALHCAASIESSSLPRAVLYRLNEYGYSFPRLCLRCCPSKRLPTSSILDVPPLHTSKETAHPHFRCLERRYQVLWAEGRILKDYQLPSLWTLAYHQTTSRPPSHIPHLGTYPLHLLRECDTVPVCLG